MSSLRPPTGGRLGGWLTDGRAGANQACQLHSQPCLAQASTGYVSAANGEWISQVLCTIIETCPLTTGVGLLVGQRHRSSCIFTRLFHGRCVQSARQQCVGSASHGQRQHHTHRGSKCRYFWWTFQSPFFCSFTVLTFGKQVTRFPTWHKSCVPFGSSFPTTRLSRRRQATGRWQKPTCSSLSFPCLTL